MCFLLTFIFFASLFAQEDRKAALSNSILLSDNFSSPRLDTQHWIFGNHPNNLSRVQNGGLALRSEGKTSGWIHTAEKYTLRDKIIQLKMVQPNGDGALGISPTVTSTSPIAFSSEQNYYRFYTSRDETSGPFRLYVQWSKAGVVDGIEVAPEIEVKPNSYLRLLTSGEILYFQFSLDGNTWQTVYAEVFALPGSTLDERFYIEIAAGYTTRNGEWIVDDFLFEKNTESAGQASRLEKIILNDPLRETSLGAQTGGKFVPGGGWQATSREDMLVYDLGRYVESGALEIQVRNFKPNEQNTYERHHFLAMFRFPWGNHHAVETQSMFWDLHTGTMYAPGVKLQSSTNFVDEKATIVHANWKKEETYRLLVAWNGKELQYFRNGALQALHTHEEPLQLRYIFVGRDYTVSGDLVTNFKGNQYPGFVGPIFSNLIVKANVPANDDTPPVVANVALVSVYANAARLSWTTNEPAVCIVEYGLTSAYGQQTAVLGPPAQDFETKLPNLAVNQTHYYRIIAMDQAGNRTRTPGATFTTMKSGLYLFQPHADTFVEKNNIYGETRSHANFGWMNLLASDGRECYLRFNVAGLNDEVAQAALRLHGRQSGKGGGKLRALQMDWEENAVTWLTKPEVMETDLGYIDAVFAEAWQGIPLRETVIGNSVYDFALLGTGETVSFDSRESTNHQPELLVVLREKDATAPVLSEVAVQNITPTSATLTWKTNEPATAIAQFSDELSSERLAADTTDFALLHRLELRNLRPYKKYRCRVTSCDVAGNVSEATDLQFETLPARVEQVALHEVFEALFTAAHAEENSFRDGPEMTLTFTGTSGAAQGKVHKASAFWDGKNAFLVRFAPPARGTWSWASQSTDAGLHGQSGTLTCAGQLPEEHISARGHVRSAALYPAALAHADSTPFFLVGTQMKSAQNVSLQSFQKYVEARAALGCNFMQISAFEISRLNDAEAGGGAAFLANNVERLNPDYWRRLDERLAYANAKGMVVGLTVLPSKAASHFLNVQQVERYVRYVVRRYSAFNVMWLLEEPPAESAITLATVAELIATHDPNQHVLVLPHGALPSESTRAYVFMHNALPEERANSNQERRLELQLIALAGDKSAAEEVLQQAWQSVMSGRRFILTEEAPAPFTEESLYSASLSFVKTLREFWSSDIHYTVPWWKFTRFIALDKTRWLAGQPGEAYVVYSASSGEFKLDLSEVQGELRGEWFNTKSGLWSTAFSGAPSRSFALKPPGEGYAAFLWVYRD